MAHPSYKTLYRRAHFLHQLGREMERISTLMDTSRVIRFSLRRLGEALQADLAIQCDLRRSDQSLQPPYRLALSPRGERALERGAKDPIHDPTGPPFLEHCRNFLQKPLGPEDRELLLVRVSSGDRVVAVLGFQRFGRNFGREDARLAQEAVEILAENLGHRDRERAQQLKERIYAKLLAELRPKDVLYQILHGLQRLLQYDHSAAVLLLGPDGRQLTIQAEIVAWTKAKSQRIGRSLPLTAEGLAWLDRPARPVLLRNGKLDPTPKPIPESLLAPLLESDPGEIPARSRILAVLRRKGEPLGVLQILGRSNAAFTPADLELLEPFLPLAAATVYHSEMYKAQHDLLVSVERKTAFADLVRAISHDLNNAFGVTLPLMEALRRDVAANRISSEQLARDLEVIAHYTEFSARIFRGILSVARGSAEPARLCDLNGVLEAILVMLGRSLQSSGIEVKTELSPDLPKVHVRRAEMEQLFLNLVYNARDAMPDGGTLTLRSSPEGEGARIEVIDTGMGIREEIRQKIFEPFFTTKPTGSGLGLDICRSIAWDYDGRLQLTSIPGEGTCATVWLPKIGRPETDETDVSSMEATEPSEVTDASVAEASIAWQADQPGALEPDAPGERERAESELMTEIEPALAPEESKDA